MFKTMNPALPLPPSPCITRWGTWLQAAVYYCDNFMAVKLVIDELHVESEAIRLAKISFSEPKTKSNLSFIKLNFQKIISGITKLQARGLSLDESIEIVDSVLNDLKAMHDKMFANKLNSVIGRNPGFNSLVSIKNILFKNSQTMDPYAESLLPNEVPYFKWCPTTSCDVERSFSQYKTLLAENRRKFLFDNIKMHLIVQCNR